MSLRIDDLQRAILTEQIRRGQVILILGAGAAYGSENSRRKPLKNGTELASHLSSIMKFPYKGEPLTEVCSAFVRNLGADYLNRILKEEFVGTRASEYFKSLFHFSWKRIYTWNIDDTYKDASRGGVQTLKVFNGMRDKVTEEAKIGSVDYVALHGLAEHPEDKFIFSSQEYTAALAGGAHAWYSKLIDDYRSYCPVFIGTALNEPILDAELERVRRVRGTDAGMAFLITPDEPSPIRTEALRSRNVLHLRGGIQDFIDFVTHEVDTRWAPADVLSETSLFDDGFLTTLSRREIDAAQALRPVSFKSAVQRFGKLSQAQRKIEARRFLTGFPSTWEIAASNVPIDLRVAKGLQQNIEQALDANRGMFVVVGPAGSGKSTSAMRALLDIESKGHSEIYELDEDAPSIADAITVLSKMNDRKKIVFVPILFIMGDTLLDRVRSARENGILFVTTARSSEWGAHLAQVYSGVSEAFEIERFVSEDHDPLIDKLLEYVPSPAFTKLTRDEQRKKLKRSNQQLLFALREATESRKFDDIIRDEFNHIQSDCAIDSFILIGIATRARVGIRPDTIMEALSYKYNSDEVADSFKALEGIVYTIASGRLLVRHDRYVRRVFSDQIPYDRRIRALTDLASTFAKYDLPIARHATRSDGLLFKFVFNHDFLAEQAANRFEAERGRIFYESQELAFQLDGQFWLQYALYVADMGHIAEGIEKIEKSLQAHPESLYAKHTLASLQLRYANQRPEYDRETKLLISEATGSLRELLPLQHLKTDEYPLVTLALRHTGVLITHGQVREAQTVAKEYLTEVQRAARTNPNPALDRVKESLVRYLSLGVWEPPSFRTEV